MACGLKKTEVMDLVLDVVRKQNRGTRNITLDTPFGDDGLGEDGIARRRYFVPIREGMETAGCGLKTLTANNMSRFKGKELKTVRDLGQAVWDDRK
jgi:hypothetical protein